MWLFAQDAAESHWFVCAHLVVKLAFLPNVSFKAHKGLLRLTASYCRSCLRCDLHMRSLLVIGCYLLQENDSCSKNVKFLECGACTIRVYIYIYIFNLHLWYMVDNIHTFCWNTLHRCWIINSAFTKKNISNFAACAMNELHFGATPVIKSIFPYIALLNLRKKK